MFKRTAPCDHYPSRFLMSNSLKKRIVLIDDDEIFCQILHLKLRKHGYQIYTINNAEDASEFIELSVDADLFIVDFDLDDVSVDGLSLCRKIKAYIGKPIIMLTGESSTDITVSCLYAGADQYIVKPYVLQELIARIHVVLNRSNSNKTITPSRKNLSFAGITLNGNKRELRSPGSLVRLTERELQLAEILFMRPEEDIPRDQIFMLISGKQMPPFNRAIDIIVGRLRKKLTQVSPNVIIRALRSSGYRLTSIGEVDEPG